MSPKMPKPAFPVYNYVDHPYRRRPAEYAEGLGWIQGGAKRRNVKLYKHFIWPKDGRNGSTWGRFKDILRNEGPDIHVSFSADKRDYMSNRPTRERWARHTNLDDRSHDGALKFELPWIGRKGTTKCYDFRTRKFVAPYKGMWTNALWPEEPNHDYTYPYAIRDVRGIWSQYASGPFAEFAEHDPNFPAIPGWNPFWDDFLAEPDMLR
jgi:hypothetical protein